MIAVKYPKIRSLSEFVSRCISLISIALLAGAASGEPVPLFSATYKVHYGILHGEMTLELRRADGLDYVYETSLTPRGLVTTRSPIRRAIRYTGSTSPRDASPASTRSGTSTSRCGLMGTTAYRRTSR